jgi:hypothetical protein
MLPIELKELLHNLKVHDFDVCGQYKVDENEARKIIKALEQQPCEDAISRTEAIKALEYDLSIEADGGLDKYKTVIKDLLNTIYNTQKKAIEDLPSVQPKQKTEVLDKTQVEITTLQNRCYSLTKGTMCSFCKFECAYKTESEE